MLGSDDIILLNVEYHPNNHVNKVGGAHMPIEIIGSDVDGVFCPGLIYPSDFSDTNYYQYRKVFIYNDSENQDGLNAKVYGYNVKNNGIVKFAIEKGNNKLPELEGQETIKNSLTAPSLYGNYDWTEVGSDSAIKFADIWRAGTGQGIWLRMATNEFVKGDALDQFVIGVKTD